MQKPVYKRELSHSYLIISDVLEETWNCYQYRMITRNRINGLLPCNERFMDGKTCLYYDISSRQSLAQVYEASKIGYIQIRGIVDNLAQVQSSMTEYLLEEACLILEPEYIYMDLETEQLFFLYYPLSETEQKGRSTYLALAEFFLEHVDHGEENAVTAAYQFYKMSRTENFTIVSFRAFLEKGIQEKNGYAERTASTLMFQEEEGIYEYRIKQRVKAEEQENDQVNTMDLIPQQEELYGVSCEQSHKGRERTERKLRICLSELFCMVGILFSGVIMAACCLFLWYVQLSETGKILGYFIMTADGVLLVFLIKKLISLSGMRKENMKEAEETGVEKRIAVRPTGNMMWESELFADEDYKGTEINGPTVFVGAANGQQREERERIHTSVPRLIANSERGEFEFELEPLPQMVGKLKSRVQILLSDASVSRIHARFVEKDGRISLIDMNSTNGTFVNEIRLEQEEIVPLEDGDEIRFGNVKMRLQI